MLSHSARSETKMFTRLRMCASDVCAGVSAHAHSTAAWDASDMRLTCTSISHKRFRGYRFDDWPDGSSINRNTSIYVDILAERMLIQDSKNSIFTQQNVCFIGRKSQFFSAYNNDRIECGCPPSQRRSHSTIPRSVLQVPWARKASSCRRRCFPFPPRPPSPTCRPCPTWTVLIPSATLSSLALSPRPSHRRSATGRPKWPSAIIGDGSAVRMRDAPRRRGVELRPRWRQTGSLDESTCHSTHLYCRCLVLEWADRAETVEDMRRRTADHFYDGRPRFSRCICLKN